ncbi:DUF2959 family protein [Dokdonella koreensis]|uniref:Glutamine synthetase n=1 Tax=Dokdonella koreensis DS-123 TaxID=1300342 RepID=A0A160DY77_9GAMM|nr:DUF2959 family protein [Dokdonella koreensis]ANB19735.1 Glutamine synthetase [Dokdonella koreensis DS-123]
MSAARRAVALIALFALLAACQSAYYGTLEKFGIAKRDVLVDRIAAARASQGEAEQAYVDALEQFRSVVAFDGGNLEATYQKLKGELDVAQARAATMSERIGAVESVADALFREWTKELTQYQDAGLRARSKGQLDRTRARYETVRQAMRRAEASFKPALAALNDQVLYLKHNLNAVAIGAIKDELPRIQADADRLRGDIRKATQEADRFLREFKTP